MKYISSDKLNYHMDRVLKLDTGQIVEPITVEYWLSMACNNKCYYCIAHKVKGPEMMSKEHIKQTIDFLKDIGVKGTILSGGGEPILNPNFLYCLDYSKEKQLPVSLITNGVLLKGKVINKVLDVCDWVRISFDAVGKEQYEKIRGTNHFEIVKQNIKELLKKKKEKKSKTTVGMQMVVNKYNFYSIANFCNMCEKEFPEIDYIQVRPLEIMINDKPYTIEQEVVINQNLEWVKKNCSKVIVSDKWDLVFGERGFGFNACHGAELIGAVHSNGNFYLCCHSANKGGYCFGNIFEIDGDKFFEVRDKILNGLKNKGLNPSICPVGCRLSGPNRFLEGLKNKHPHENYI